jgi:hypothetical protein
VTAKWNTKSKTGHAPKCNVEAMQQAQHSKALNSDKENGLDNKFKPDWSIKAKDVRGQRSAIFPVVAEMEHSSSPEKLEGAVQWSNKVDKSVSLVSNEYDNHWPGQGMCCHAAGTSESCVMVNVTKNPAEGHLRQ